jgi:hypothetical protein
VGPGRLVLSLGSSGDLAKQMEIGAPPGIV